MLCTSRPITGSVVSRRSVVNWVNRQKKNCWSEDDSIHSRALLACMWRSHTSATQILASRKFNVFIDLFVGQVDFRAVRNDQRKLHMVRMSGFLPQQRFPDSHENQLSRRTAAGGSLHLQL